MDIRSNLIVIKGEDKTDQIGSCHFEQGKWHVMFHNANKVYTYNEKDVVWYRDPNIMDHSASIVYDKNQPLSGIDSILNFDTHIRIIFNSGYKKTYRSADLTIEQTCLSNKKASNSFEYLKSLADHVSVSQEEDISFLSKQYNKLFTISPRSVLATYLERKPLKREENNLHLIFPFGFNGSQKIATEIALKDQVSVIEGPPGTGKTQTILNIIANAVINQKTVAVVSNNNSATANVLEKLQKYGLDFIVAYLGNKENKKNFFGEKNDNYPNMRDWVLEDSDYETIKINLRESQDTLNKMLEVKNKQALLKQELSALKTEYGYYEDFYTNSKFKQIQLKSFIKLRSDQVLQLLIEYKQKLQKGRINISNKLHNFFIYGIYNFKFYKNPSEDIVSFLQKTYYELKENELKNNIDELERKLNRYNFESTMKEYSEDSMKIFKATLAKEYGQGGVREVFNEDVLWKNFDAFIKEYPVILSTTHSLRNCAAKNYLFDYVLIDEASQVDIVTGSLALSCAKNAVIVGDTKQLPNVVPSDVKEKTTRIFKSFELDQGYNYAEHSLLTSIVSLFSDVPRTLLKEHYRCHPKIIGFCNQKFYNNELIVLTDNNELDKPLRMYKTAKGNHARGTYNQRQIDTVFNEIIPNHKINSKKQSVGIITPYRLQANKFQKAIGAKDIEADTVHKFQGREKDIIILSTVSNDIKVNDFVDDPNLINVAVSRAVKELIVIAGEGIDKRRGTNIGDLVRYIKYNNFDVIESKIHSVFDLLYSSYSNKLLEVMKNSRKVSEHMSENLMNIVFEKVMKQEEFKDLNYVLHQPLRMLIKDTAKLTSNEYKYAMNILTHTDFLIFNKLDKIPVLVVEVDGHDFHANNPKQLERDRMKDNILNKYGIPIIRMKTTGSGEEVVLRGKLLEILNLEVS